MAQSKVVAEHRQAGRGRQTADSDREGAPPQRRRRKKSLTRDERETIIQRTAADEGWSFYTCDGPPLRRIEKLAAEHPDDVRLLRRSEYGAEWEIPLKWVNVRPPKRMSEKTRQQRIAQLAKARQKQQKGSPSQSRCSSARGPRLTPPSLARQAQNADAISENDVA